MKILLGFNVIHPLVQSIHNLIKVNQLLDFFICVFVLATKMCQNEIYELYLDLNTRFKFDAFDVYKSLLFAKHESIVTCWTTYLNTNMEHLTFHVNQQHMWATHFNL